MKSFFYQNMDRFLQEGRHISAISNVPREQGRGNGENR